MVAIALAVGLLAAACGSETVTTEGGAPADQVDQSSEPAGEAAAPAEDEGPEAEGPTVEQQEEEAAEAAAVGPHNFPDLGTVNIADGSSLNLADELAGGDTPVLLWFFAPH